MTVFKKSNWIRIIFVPAVLLLAVFLAGCEIRSIDPKTGEVIIEKSVTTFNATKYVDGVWEERVFPAIQNDAIDLVQLLDSLKNSSVTIEQYGLVKGKGQVVKVDISSRVGFLRVEIPGLGQQMEVKLQIGPVISGTALRDALPFIQFDQFTNQIQYASVSMAIHDKLMKTVLANLDYAKLEGQMIRFRGALSYDEGEVVITPVIIEILE